MRDDRTYELRIYRATPGQMDALLQRFVDATIAIFRRHRITSLSYWVERDDPEVLTYLVVHEGDPETNWTGFYADREWIEVKAETEAKAGGRLTSEVRSVLLSTVPGLPPGDPTA